MKTLYPHQVEAAQLGFRRNLLLADETGAGKTLAALEIARLCTEQVGGHSLFIVTKKAAQQWQTEIHNQFPQQRQLRLSKDFSPIWFKVTEPMWFVAHYEVVVKIWPILATYRWTCVVLDEAHRIKTRSTKSKQVLRTDAVKKGTVKAQRKVALTGTPWDKDPAEVWSIVNWLYPHHYTSYWRFREQHTRVITDFMGYEHVQGVKDAARFAAELVPYTLKRSKHDLRADLPPLIVNHVPVEMDAKQLAAYRKVEASKDLIVEVEDTELTISNVLAWITRLLQISSDPQTLGLELPSGKLTWLRDWIEDNPNEPAIIFTRFRKTAIALAHELEADLIVGGSEGNASDFLSGKKNVLVGTIGAMGESLNLQRANTAIFIDQDWSSATMKQAMDRLHRIDITDPKQVIFLTSSPVDMLVYEAFTNKWTEQHLVFEALKLIRSERKAA